MADLAAVELATAYISLVPSMQGAQASIASALVPGATSAGAEAGMASGTAMKAGLLKYLGPAALFAGVALAAKGLYGIGETWDDVTDTIRTGTGAQGEALDGLVQSVKNVGVKVPAEFGNIGTAVADLNTRLGLTGPTLETVASQYLEAGRILGEDVDIAKTTAAFNAFGIEGESVVGAMDSLFQVSQATGVGMNDLAATVQANAPAMQNLGFSFEETASLAGSLDKAGLNSTQTFAAMSKGMVTLAKDGEAPQDAFARVTGEIDDMIKSGDIAGAIDLSAGIFGTRGASQFVGAVQRGTLALDDLVGATGATSDTILGVGQDTQDFAETWQIVKNNASAALEPLGSAVFTGIGDALKSTMPYLASFAGWLTDNQWALGVVVGIIGVALVAGFYMLAASVWTATAAMLANPITWIILGIVALIAGLVLLISNWDTVVVWLKDVWGSIVGWLAEVWTSITSGITSAWNAIASFFTGLWASITGAASTAWNGITSFIGEIPGRILAFFLNWTLPGLLISHWDSIKTGAVNGFTAVVDFVRGIPGEIVSALGSIGSLLYNAGMDILDGFLRGLTRGFDAVKDFVGGIGSWIADHKGPKAYDLALLQPNAGWIMDGLRTGLENEIPALESSLNKVTGAMSVGGNLRLSSSGLTGGLSTPSGPTYIIDGLSFSDPMPPEVAAWFKSVGRRSRQMAGVSA